MAEYVCRGREQLQAVASRIVCELNPDKIWRVSITQHKSRRSLEQNDRFHKLIALLADETGESPKRLKEWVKAEFGPMVVIEVCGAVKTIPKPSHEYTVEEMSAVMDRFEAWCGSEIGIALG